jgi:TIR domain
MAESTHQGDKLNVFISYSRGDLAFADQLDAALGLAGFETTIDRHGISPGEDWQTRLGGLIRDADTVIFVLSPSSARSKVCAWEAAEATRLGKRILPVLCRPLKSANPPPQLAKLNYIFFYAELKSPGSGWGTGLVMLASALNTDIEWLREHTRYLQRATEWEAGEKPAKKNRLLSGPDIATAKAWAARRPKNAPEPTALQLNFIKESEDEDVRTQSLEAQRLLDIEEAQAAREVALAEREEAQKREAEQAKRVVWRTLAGLAAAIILTLVALGFGVFAEQQRKTADEQRKLAERQLDRANQAIAESINNDLGFESENPSFTNRQRQALWGLALTDEPVKGKYVSILAGSPEEMVRASPGFAKILRALGLLRPSAAESESLATAVAGGIQWAWANNIGSVDPLIKEFAALTPRITEAQASRAIEPVLKQIGQRTDPYELRNRALALQALPVKLTEARAAQAGQAVEAVLKQIAQTTNPEALLALAQALEALPVKLTEAQASQAVEPMLKQVGQTTDAYELRNRALALQALPVKLTEAQMGQAVEAVLKPIGQTTDPDALWARAYALKALPVKLSEAQAAQAIEAVLKQVGQTTNPKALWTLANALKALPVKLSEAQAAQAIEAVLKQMGETSNPDALRDLAGALQTLPAKLTEAQASRAIEPLLKQVGQTTDLDAPWLLAQALEAVPVKPTEAQASQALNPLLKQIGQATNPDTLQWLIQVLKALATNLTETQTSQALNPVLKQMSETSNPDALRALAGALPDLAPNLTEAQVSRTIDLLLTQMGRTTDVFALQALARALEVLAAKLNEAQAAQTIDPLIKQIGQTTESDALQALLRALQALAPKLSEAQAVQASKAAATSLAWSANDDEAVEWARALAALSHRAAGQDGMLAAAIAYPTTAGPATEILLDAIRAGHPDAPAKEAGTEAALEWLAKKYPDVLRPPLCPQPLQSGLKCPPSASQ